LLFRNLVHIYFYFLEFIGHGFIIKKRKSGDENESSVPGTSSGSITRVTVSVISKSFVRRYNEEYLSFGFISSGEEQPRQSVLFVVRNWQTKLWFQVS
jgi:hypothetical protein